MRVYLLLIVFFIVPFVHSQNVSESISYRYYKKEASGTIINFAVKGVGDVLAQNPYVQYKYQSNDWHYIRCTPATLGRLMEAGQISQIYFDPAKPHTMNDTMRIVQNVDSVHLGAAPLGQPYTGKNIIIGYIDSGIDHAHEDFKNEDGTSRILYYWDHTLGYDVDRTPLKYGYGQVWTNEDIDAGVCVSSDENAHGTTVSGTGSGNGRATGTHQGVAPQSDIIIVETNFSLPNWTLSVADGVDFIFSMADNLGKPAVVNTSVGTYLGSHDGTDPAAMIIDSLLNDKPGRIVVAAAGNAGNQGKYHLKGVVDEDTSFTWFDVNPSSAFGVPATYFDLWADTADFKDVFFAFGADRVNPSFQFRGRTAYYSIESLVGITTYDTIWAEGHALSPVEFFAEEINGVYHLEMVMLDPDSADYYFRFETTGLGEFDLWSGAWLGAANIVNTGLPAPLELPEIIHYQLPDTLSTTVSSWACSPLVVTVGNFKTQYDYISYTGEPYVLSGGPPGQLSLNSSKGPNRVGHIKPDISATGDGIMSSCPLWLSSSLIVSNPTMLAAGGQHVRNGGTSMASPVIAGIAALYLEKCPTSTYQDFLDDLHELAYEDFYTSTTPNMGYGYGKIDAFHLLNSTNYSVTLIGDTLICDDPVVFSAVEGPFDQYEWFNGETSPEITLDETAIVFTTTKNDQGCASLSDTIVVIKGTLPPIPTINIIGGGLVSSPADAYIWYFEGVAIDSSDMRFFNPDSSGYYSVEVFGPEGCSYLSDAIYVDLSQIVELKMNEFVIFPNPFISNLNIITSDFLELDLILTDLAGNLVYAHQYRDNESMFITIDLDVLASGIYLLNLYYENNFSSYKLVKL